MTPETRKQRRKTRQRRAQDVAREALAAALECDVTELRDFRPSQLDNASLSVLVRFGKLALELGLQARSILNRRWSAELLRRTQIERKQRGMMHRLRNEAERSEQVTAVAD